MATTLKLDTVEYVLDEDRKATKKEQTIFFLHPLTFSERTTIQDNLIETEVQTLGPKNKKRNKTIQHIKLGEQMEKSLTWGIQKIDNLKDPDGKIISYHINMDDKKKLSVLDLFPLKWCSELSQEILRISGMGVDEEKN